jgi:hypothetical protein
LDSALDFWENDVPEALSLFSKNHLSIAVQIYLTELQRFPHLMCENRQQQRKATLPWKSLSSTFHLRRECDALNAIVGPL